SLQAGDNEPAFWARHCTIRPPPGCTPPHTERTSPPQAERSTNNSSRGRIGRSTMAAGAVAAPGAAAVAPSFAGAAAGAAPPLAAATAFSQLADSFVLFFSKHCSAAAPPVGTP